MRVAEVFQDSAGEWRWHVKAGNGEIVAEGEGHTRQRDAVRALSGAEVEYDRLDVLEEASG